MSGGRRLLQGRYYDGRQPIGAPAMLRLEGSNATMMRPESDAEYSLAQLWVSPRAGRSDRFVALPDGSQFQCRDDSWLDRLPQEVWSEGPVAWLEQRWWFALGALAITAALLIGAYLYGLPVLAERVASHVPIETERVLGDQTLTWLDTRQWFLPTTLAADVQNRIRDGFAMLVAGLPVERNCRLEFRAAHILGANAFALPGGTIVITDAMVEATISQEEVLAILAHEVGHVELRHTLRMLLQGSAVGVAAAAITGDAASLSGAMTGLPYLMVETSYSRQFETQADDFAFRLLKQRAISPAAFADIMERLRAKDDTERPFAFLATHPLTAERVRRARAAALP